MDTSQPETPKPYTSEGLTAQLEERVQQAILQGKPFSSEGLPIVEHDDLMQTLEALMRAYIVQDNPDGFLALFTAYANVLDDPKIAWQEIHGTYTLEFAGAINREAFRLRAEGMSSQSDALMKLCKKLGFFVNEKLTSIYDVEAKASYDREGKYDRT